MQVNYGLMLRAVAIDLAALILVMFLLLNINNGC